MGGGTVAATCPNGFMLDNFPEMIVYGHCNTREQNKMQTNARVCFAERVTHLLEHPGELAALRETTREKVLSEHMPLNRAEKILLAREISGRSEVSLYE
jgi:hypothetical protein